MLIGKRRTDRVKKRTLVNLIERERKRGEGSRKRKRKENRNRSKSRRNKSKAKQAFTSRRDGNRNRNRNRTAGTSPSVRSVPVRFQDTAAGLQVGDPIRRGDVDTDAAVTRRHRDRDRGPGGSCCCSSPLRRIRDKEPLARRDRARVDVFEAAVQRAHAHRR